MKQIRRSGQEGEEEETATPTQQNAVSVEPTKEGLLKVIKNCKTIEHTGQRESQQNTSTRYNQNSTKVKKCQQNIKRQS